MNQIDIDIKTLSKEMQDWVNFEIAESNKYDIGVKLLSKKAVKVDGVRCSGYFCDSTPELVVACYMSDTKWLPILVHESCHRDQFIQKIPVWNQRIEWEGEMHPPLGLLHDWLTKTIELSKTEIKEVVTACAALELDCEIRSAAKINEFYLPINVKEYVQKANAYVYFYLVMAHTRAWYPKGKSPFYMADVWTKMPTDFNNDYTKLPLKFKKLILERCFNAD
jgi:hypothetical protein